MFGLPPSVRIDIATELPDMRNGIDGLRAIVEGALRHDPYNGHLFVFVGKTKDKVKILFWDRSGFVLYSKRLEKGRFQLPVVDAKRKHVEMEPAHLAAKHLLHVLSSISSGFHRARRRALSSIPSSSIAKLRGLRGDGAGRAEGRREGEVRSELPHAHRSRKVCGPLAHLIGSRRSSRARASRSPARR